MQPPEVGCDIKCGQEPRITEKELTMTFAELPEEWQKKIKDLQGMNRDLLKLNGFGSKFEGLPPSWQSRITQLRKENGKYRTERKALVAELAALRAELEARGK